MSISRLLRTVQLALKSLMLHKLRSGLTMLGIVFGVFSVIAMLAIGEGASAQAQQQVLELGATNIIIISVKPPIESSNDPTNNSWVLRYGLKRADFKQLTAALPDDMLAQAVQMRELGSEEARFLHRTINSRLVGCTTEYVDMNHLELSAGRFITDRDQEEKANVVVIADEVAQQLFKLETPIGHAIQIRSRKYRIVGVTKSRTASAAIGGSLSGQDYNKDIYIPLETFRVRIAPRDQTFKRQAGTFSAEEVQLSQITLKLRDEKDVLAVAEFVNETLERNHSRRDFAVIVPLELLRQAEQIRNIFNIVLGSIAAISLVVGGIGIMNIMLATVTERTREIGIRRALGAKRRDIIQQFLTETIVLAGTGGVIGILLGLSTPHLFGFIQWFVENFVVDGPVANSEIGKIFSGMKPQIAYWSLPVAFGISVGIGIIFGLYPARAAAKLDPIEALRHE